MTESISPASSFSLDQWTREEDRLLVDRIQKKGLSSWPKIAKVFADRHTAEACQQRAVFLLNLTAETTKISFGDSSSKPRKKE